MKKTNKKGFTLVELIVVATIMVMIMGAILNWIRPMNKFYDRTQSLADSNDIGSLLMDAVDDEIRYCTNVLVLQNYQGMPVVQNGYLMSSSGRPSSSAKFTDVLIIDNNNFRGQLFDDYDANGTVAHRKGARGCIMHAYIPSETGIIETDRLKCIGQGGEALYSEYGCHFDAVLNSLDNGSKCVTIDMTVSRPRLQGGSYVFDKFGYDQSRDFELVNVNLKKNNMKADFYTATGEGKAIDYTKFAQATEGASGNQELLLRGTYTYIFYTKDFVEGEKVTVSLIDDITGDEIIPSFEKESGANLTPGEITNMWNSAENYRSQNWELDPNDPTKHVKWKCDGILDEDNQDYKIYENTGISSNLVLTAKYSQTTRDDAPDTMTFYDKFDDDGKDINYAEAYKRTKDFYPPDSSKGDDGTFTYGYKGTGDKEGMYTFVGWNTKKDVDLTNVPKPSYDPDNPDPAKAATDLSWGWFVEGAQYTKGVPYYAIYEKKDTILLVYTVNNSDDLDTLFFINQEKYLKELTYEDLIKDSRFTAATEDVKKAAKPGLTFIEWILTDSDDNEIGKLKDVPFSSLTTDELYKAKAVFNKNTHPGSYEVTINILQEPKGTGWNALNMSPVGTSANYTLTEADGVTEIPKDGSSNNWYGQWSNIVYPGRTFKLYVNEGVTIDLGVCADLSAKGINGNCTVEYDGYTTKIVS